jgi:hypothetical protein
MSLENLFWKRMKTFLNILINRVKCSMPIDWPKRSHTCLLTNAQELSNVFTDLEFFGQVSCAYPDLAIALRSYDKTSLPDPVTAISYNNLEGLVWVATENLSLSSLPKSFETWRPSDLKVEEKIVLKMSRLKSFILGQIIFWGLHFGPLLWQWTTSLAKNSQSPAEEVFQR